MRQPLSVGTQRGMVMLLVTVMGLGLALLAMHAARQSQTMQWMAGHYIAEQRALSATTTALQQLSRSWLNDDANVVVWPLTALAVSVSEADCDLSSALAEQWSMLPWQSRDEVDVVVVQAPPRCQVRAGAFNEQGESVVAEVVVMLARSRGPVEVMQYTLLRRAYRQPFPPAEIEVSVSATAFDVPPSSFWSWPCQQVYWPGEDNQPVRLGQVCEGQQAWRRLP